MVWAISAAMTISRVNAHTTTTRMMPRSFFITPFLDLRIDDGACFLHHPVVHLTHRAVGNRHSAAHRGSIHRAALPAVPSKKFAPPWGVGVLVCRSSARSTPRDSATSPSSLY